MYPPQDYFGFTVIYNFPCDSILPLCKLYLVTRLQTRILSEQWHALTDNNQAVKWYYLFFPCSTRTTMLSLVAHTAASC